MRTMILIAIGFTVGFTWRIWIPTAIFIINFPIAIIISVLQALKKDGGV